VATPTPEGPARPALRRSTHRVLFASVAVGWLLLDQLSKSWAVRNLTGRDVDVLWTLRFNLAYNSGASFSMGEGWGRWIALIAVLIVGLLVWQGLTVRTRLAAVALALIVGGALGNVVDRALRAGGGGFLGGSVVDFIDLQWWPVFNVADMGVVVGAILLVVSSFLPVPDDGETVAAEATDGSAAASTDDGTQADGTAGG
jgi:signal peptidase II